MSERRLDYSQRLDERSKAYAVSRETEALIPFSKRWRTPLWLDQGTEGACTGFSAAHALASTPNRTVTAPTNTYAEGIYERAKQLDEWPGEDYVGSSVIAAAQTLVERGLVTRYRWAMNPYELALGITVWGPAVLGLDWLDSMWEPKNGNLDCSGKVAGGHAILCNGLDIVRYPAGTSHTNPADQINPKLSRFRLHNSWGRSWGNDGEAWVSWADLERLVFGGSGEACFLSKRQRGVLA